MREPRLGDAVWYTTRTGQCRSGIVRFVWHGREGEIQLDLWVWFEEDREPWMVGRVPYDGSASPRSWRWPGG